VVAVAVPATGELLLLAASDVLQELAPLTSPAAAPDATAGLASGLRAVRSRVRPRWQPAG
jgi:hypothetical protein